MKASVIEHILIPIAQLLIYVFFFSSIYLLVKYRSVVFWEKASKKELIFPVVGFLGAFVFGVIIVLTSYMLS